MKHHTEAFTESFAEWGVQCFTCGYEATGFETLEEAESAGDEHDRSPHVCSECADCLHDGRKCCGCYDGACCQVEDPS